MKIVKRCEQCSIEFDNKRKNREGDTRNYYISRGQFSKTRFCSLKCSGKSQRGQKRKKHTKEWKKAQSERMRGDKHPMWGKKMSKESRKKMSISAKNKPPMKEETRRKIAFAHSGKKSYLWKGDKVGYYGLHAWIQKTLGRPKMCAHCDIKTAKKYEWCSIGHLYKRDISNWVRLCTRCHRNYDYGNLTIKVGS